VGLDADLVAKGLFESVDANLGDVGPDAEQVGEVEDGGFLGVGHFGGLVKSKTKIL